MHPIYKFVDMVSVGNLHWRYLLIDRIYRWRHKLGQRNFPGIGFWWVTAYFKCQSPHKLWSCSLEVVNLVTGQTINDRLEYG